MKLLYIAVILVAGLIGCSEENPVSGDATEPAAVTSPTATSPTLAVPTCDPQQPCGEEADVDGTLAADGSGCVWLETDDGAVNVRWPTGFTASQANGEIELVDEQGQLVASEGDTLDMIGGTYQADTPGCAPEADPNLEAHIGEIYTAAEQ